MSELPALRLDSAASMHRASERQYNAAIAGLIGIAPQDEIEGMFTAQLIAAHQRPSWQDYDEQAGKG